MIAKEPKHKSRYYYLGKGRRRVRIHQAHSTKPVDILTNYPMLNPKFVRLRPRFSGGHIIIEKTTNARGPRNTLQIRIHNCGPAPLQAGLYRYSDTGHAWSPEGVMPILWMHASCIYELHHSEEKHCVQLHILARPAEDADRVDIALEVLDATQNIDMYKAPLVRKPQ